MATKKQKIVKVGNDLIAFPGDLEDAHVAKAIQTHKAKNSNTPPASSPESILNSILAAHKGFASVYSPTNTGIVIADPARRTLARKFNAGSGLEFWPASETGTTQFPRPANMQGKSVLEIYSPELSKNTAQLRTAIYGDLMHGMVGNPHWKSLRDQFMSNFTPQELQRIKEHRTWWDDVNAAKINGSNVAFGPIYDAYIRGWIADEGNSRQGQVESKNTMYSPKQVEILEEMKQYLETGKKKAPIAKNPSTSIPKATSSSSTSIDRVKQKASELQNKFRQAGLTQ